MKDAVDRSPAGIEARLRAAAVASPLGWRSAPCVDLSAAAVEERLRECAELSRVCLELAEPGPGGRG